MKTPEHTYYPACARCRDEAGKDRAGVTDTSLCNWHTNDLVLTLRAENARLRERIDELEAAINEAAEYTSSAGIQHILCKAMKRDVPEWAK